ncbi:MAG: pilus assembly protein PilM [Clostridiales bacterium]|nr:pilus assembly protein PilM [Clostridiales bacterium]
MATKVLGIELGERLIKVCETNMGPGVRKAHGCIMFRTPPEAVSDGEIKNPEAVASALKENLQKHGLKNKKVVFTISSGRIAIREVTIPPVREAKIKAIVESNAADYFPVDMSKYHITYTLQEKKTTGEDAGNRLLVMAAPMAILDGYFGLAALMGFSVQAVDYSGNSQFRLLETMNNDSVTMYVDVNGSYSITTVLKKNQLLMQRMFQSGVDDYVLEYMGGSGHDEGDYLGALRELGTATVPVDYGEPAAGEPNEYLSRLVGNITRIAEYYNSSNWDNAIERLVLTGIGAPVAGLKEAVAEATGLTVTVMQRLDKVSAPNNLASVLPMYISCLGCSAAPVDFIPERYSKAKKKEKKKTSSVSMGVTILLVGILGGAALSAFAIIGYMSVLDEKAALERKVADLAYAETVYNNSLVYRKYQDDMTVFENTIKSPNDELRQFIDELEKKMPAEINILSARCTKEGISMNVTVTSKPAAAKTIQQLRSFASISDIVVGQITETPDESGNRLVSFSVDCKYNAEPAEPAEKTGALASGQG